MIKKRKCVHDFSIPLWDDIFPIIFSYCNLHILIKLRQVSKSVRKNIVRISCDEPIKLNLFPKWKNASDLLHIFKDFKQTLNSDLLKEDINFTTLKFYLKRDKGSNLKGSSKFMSNVLSCIHNFKPQVKKLFDIRLNRSKKYYTIKFEVRNFIKNGIDTVYLSSGLIFESYNFLEYINCRKIIFNIKNSNFKVSDLLPLTKNNNVKKVKFNMMYKDRYDQFLFQDFGEKMDITVIVYGNHNIFYILRNESNNVKYVVKDFETLNLHLFCKILFRESQNDNIKFNDFIIHKKVVYDKFEEFIDELCSHGETFKGDKFYWLKRIKFSCYRFIDFYKDKYKEILKRKLEIDDESLKKYIE